jgi:SAM-dependent methyltransferase
LYPVFFDEARFARAETDVRQVLRLAGRRRGAVLDLCCGPGRHAVELARRGFKVTAVDRTSFLLSKAKRRAREARVKVEFVHSDMREFVRPVAFDVALNLWTSFGYFKKKGDDLRVLQNIHRSLKPRGVLVMELLGKERLARGFQGTTVEHGPGDTLLVQRHEIFDDWTRVRNTWILIESNRVRRFKFQHTVYSGQELRDLLLRAEFSSVQLFGGLDGQSYGLDASRLIAVARKG